MVEETHRIVIFNLTTGDTQKNGIPKKWPNLAFTCLLLVQCIKIIAVELPNVIIQKGVGVVGVTQLGKLRLWVELNDGTTIHATHGIGANEKWLNVRWSSPSFFMTMTTCPTCSATVHINMAKIPNGWDSKGSYYCIYYFSRQLRHVDQYDILWPSRA